ncbi:MAG: hypothetical protein ACRDFB_01020, partial [Rhabdochlamydiaceae bacterium]
MNLIFTWDDVKHIIERKQKKIIRLSFFCGLITFLYFLAAPLQYEARATFKQASSRADQSSDIKNLLLRSFSTAGPEGTSATLMLSDTILGKTIEKMGLQVELKNDSRWDLLFRSAMNNILAEMGISTRTPEFAQFSSVSYLDEKPLKMVLRKVSETTFSLYDDKQRLLTNGIIGQPLAVNEFKLTLNYLPFNGDATLILHPIQPIIHNLRKNLTIKPTHEDKNLLLIKCLDRDRKRSAE